MQTIKPKTKRTGGSSPQSRPQVLVVLIMVAVLAAACSSAGESATTETATTETATTESASPTAEPIAEPTTAPTPEPTAAPTATATPEPTATDVPIASTSSGVTPAASTLEWVVTLFNNPETSTDEIADKFAPEFLEIVPIEQIVGSLPQFWGADWAIGSSDIGQFEAAALLTADGENRLNAQVVVSEDEPHLIEALLFTAAFETPIVTNVQEYEQALAAIAPNYQVAVFEIIDNECAAVIDLGADTVVPTGSVFKLWVLAELAHQVEAGDAAWDKVLPVSNAWKSSPDGPTFAMAEGTDITLRSYAEEMISLSDNSATDHLIYHLGRTNVEAAMIASGVSEPERNIPMLSTADLFRLKFDPEPPNSDDYRAATPDERRTMLDAWQDETWIESVEDLPLTNADGVSIESPRDHDIEWFATPRDICATHAYLAELAARPGLEPIADILSINGTAGMAFDEDVWTNLRYKGGAEQGIATVAWRMERADGRIFVLAGAVENPEAPVNVVDAVATMQLGAVLAAEID